MCEGAHAVGCGCCALHVLPPSHGFCWRCFRDACQGNSQRWVAVLCPGIAQMGANNGEPTALPGGQKLRESQWQHPKKHIVRPLSNNHSSNGCGFNSTRRFLLFIFRNQPCMVGVGADCGVVALLSRCPFGRPGDSGTAVHVAAAGVLLACCCCCSCAWSAMAAAVLRCPVRELGHSGELGKGFQRACECEEVISGSQQHSWGGVVWCK